MSAAWAYVEVRQGKRWLPSLSVLGLGERSSDLEDKIREYFVQHREQFGILPLLLDLGEEKKFGAVVMRLAKVPDLVYAFELRVGELDSEIVAEYQERFGNLLGG